MNTRTILGVAGPAAGLLTGWLLWGPHGSEDRAPPEFEKATLGPADSEPDDGAGKAPGGPPPSDDQLARLQAEVDALKVELLAERLNVAPGFDSYPEEQRPEALLDSLAGVEEFVESLSEAHGAEWVGFDCEVPPCLALSTIPMPLVEGTNERLKGGRPDFEYLHSLRDWMEDETGLGRAFYLGAIQPDNRWLMATYWDPQGTKEEPSTVEVKEMVRKRLAERVGAMHEARRQESEATSPE